MAAVQQASWTEVSTKSPQMRPRSDTFQSQSETDQQVLEEKESGNPEVSETHGPGRQRRMDDSVQYNKDEVHAADVLADTDQEKDLQTKQAAEVAAAARFISQVDKRDPDTEVPLHSMQKPRLSSTTSVRDSILESSFNMSKSRSSKPLPHTGQRRNKILRPPPLQTDKVLSLSLAEESQSPLPERTSSKGAPTFDLAKTPDATSPSLDQVVGTNHEMETKGVLPRLPEDKTPFQFNFSTSIEPRLSRSISAASTASQSPSTPPTMASEDQGHQDVEPFALGRAPDHPESQQPARPSGPPPSLPGKDRTLTALPAHAEPPQEAVTGKQSMDTTAPALRRKRSIFGWLQKRAEVDVEDLIDLYLTDEQLEEVKTTKQKPSKPRLAIFRNRTATDPLPLKGG